MRYTLRQLEIFVDVARDCSFAKAAGRLGISQPAVSDHIRSLEGHLAAELFARRRGTTATLTAAGERLRQEAELLLDRGARLSGRTAAATKAVSVKLFAGPHIFDRTLRGALPAFYRAHPDIALAIVSEFAAGEVSALLDRHELDLAVFTAPAASLPEGAEVLCEAPCLVVASRRLAGDAELGPRQISALPFVLPLEDSRAARWVDQALAGLGIAPETIAGRTQFVDVQQRMVETGEAAALLFREGFESSPAHPELRALSPDVPGLQRALVLRRGERRPEVLAVAAFIREAIGAGEAAG